MLLLAPAAAMAQQAAPPPDGTSVNEPPAGGPEAQLDACGNSMQDTFGQPTLTDINDLNPKDVTGAQPTTNLSSVSGVVVHTSGDLMLLQIPREPAAGTATDAVSSMAVVRLPSGCLPSISDGVQVNAIGVPSVDGILNAEQLQTSP